MWVTTFPFAANAQHFWKRHYTVEDGLPSNEAYHLIQDRKGYLWFATDNGLSRYDGYDFENFHVNDGLVDPIIFELTEDYRGRIWYGGYSSRLGYYDEGTFHAYQYNDLISRDRQWVSHFRSIYVDRKETVHIGFHRTGYLAIDASGNHRRAEQKRGMLYQQIDDSVDFYSYRDLSNWVQQLGGRADTHYVTFSGAGRSWVHALPPFFPGHFTGMHPAEDGYMIHALRKLFFVNEDTVRLEHQFDGLITWAHQDRFGRIWVCLERSGVRVYKAREWERPLFEFPEMKRVSGMLEDREGGYWLTSAKYGIYYLRETPFEVVDVSERKRQGDPEVHAITVGKNGVVYLGLGDNKVGRWDRRNDTYSVIHIRNDWHSKHYRFPVTFLKYDAARDVVWGSHAQSFFRLTKGSLNKESIPVFHGNVSRGRIRTLFIDSTDEMISGGDHNILLWRNGEVVRSLLDTSSIHRLWVHSLWRQDRDTLWVGMNNGLWVLTDETELQPFDRYPRPSMRVNDLLMTGKNTLWVATRGEGIFVYGAHGVKRVTVSDGLTSNNITNLSVDRDGYIWVATWEGLNRINIHDDGSLEIDRFGKEEGLPSGKINQVLCWQGELFVATKGGLFICGIRELTTEHPLPEVHMRSVYVNHALAGDRDTLTLLHNENNLQFDFVGVAYRKNGDIQYRYRLDMTDQTWNYTRNRSVTFSQLRPGKYTFRVAAGSQKEGWGDEAALYVHILAPFWETWWFQLLIVSAAGVGIAVLFRYLLLRSKRQAGVKSQVKELKLQALRAQMNPHFIFNVLHAIQTMIGKNDALQAQEYLANFAALIRTSLDHSIQTWVPIQDEVSLLQQYLELERVRFQVELRYTIIIDESLRQKTWLIPTMLIQPFVENALVHGLAGKRSDCRVEVALSMEGDAVQCVVTDNGIGREAARASKHTEQLHKSVGVTITAKRLELIRGESDGITGIRYEDLKDDRGKASGTRVVLHIPYRQHRNDKNYQHESADH